MAKATWPKLIRIQRLVIISKLHDFDPANRSGRDLCSTSPYVLGIAEPAQALALSGGYGLKQLVDELILHSIRLDLIRVN